MASIAQTAEWKALEAHVTQVQGTHLKDLLQDDARTESMIREHNGIYVDFSRQNATQDTIKVKIVSSITAVHCYQDKNLSKHLIIFSSPSPSAQPPASSSDLYFFSPFSDAH
jgi:hypothetical protein